MTFFPKYITISLFNRLAMNSSASERLDATFLALADPTRRAILAWLVTLGEAPVNELAEPFAISQPAISKHLKVLERAGLVLGRSGRAAEALKAARRLPPLAEVSAWIERYREIWEASFERLDALLAELQRRAEGNAPASKKRKKERSGIGARSRR